MFVRRKQNKSGIISIQVVAKVSGKYRVQKSFGSSRDEATLISLERKARQWADEQEFGEELFIQDDAAAYDAVFAGIGQNQLRLVGRISFTAAFSIRLASVRLGLPMTRFLRALWLHACITREAN